MSDVTYAPRLYFDKLSVAKYDFEKLRNHGSSIARKSALYSGRNAKNATSDDAGGLSYAYMQPLTGRRVVSWGHWCSGRPTLSS